MAGNGLNVKDIDEAKRLWKLGLTNRQIARATKIHRNTINKYVEKFKNEKSIAAVEVKPIVSWYSEVDWERVRSEYLSGVSLNVIHEELVESKIVPVQYAGFWKQARTAKELKSLFCRRCHLPPAMFPVHPDRSFYVTGP